MPGLGSMAALRAISTTAWVSVVIINLHLYKWFGTPAGFRHAPCYTTSLVGFRRYLLHRNLDKVHEVEQLQHVHGYPDNIECTAIRPFGSHHNPSILIHLLKVVHIIQATLQSENSGVISRSTPPSGRAISVSHRRHALTRSAFSRELSFWPSQCLP
ncbi:hypothetical protein EDD21DRAFT_403426 [Dissophora ornata]|nr:hypothetical protein EDD21DRAFT_403426 [Dissophora ornata]